MIKLISLLIIAVIIAVGVDYVITDSFSQAMRASVGNKYTDGDIYVIKTISLETFNTNKEIYNRLEIGKTYDFKILMGGIREAKEV